MTSVCHCERDVRPETTLRWEYPPSHVLGQPHSGELPAYAIGVASLDRSFDEKMSLQAAESTQLAQEQQKLATLVDPACDWDETRTA